jgi:hypothetical protein
MTATMKAKAKAQPSPRKAKFPTGTKPRRWRFAPDLAGMIAGPGNLSTIEGLGR